MTRHDLVHPAASANVSPTIGRRVEFTDSSHRSEPPSPEQMEMKVKNHLSTVALTVEERAIPPFGHTLSNRELTSDCQHMTEQIWIIRFVEARDMSSRDDKNMHRRHGMDVAKSHDPLVLVKNPSVGFTRDDTTKDTFTLPCHGRSPSFCAILWLMPRTICQGR